MRDVAVITASPFAAGYSPFELGGRRDLLRARRLDPTPGPPCVVARVDESYARLRPRGRPVVAVSQAILDRIEPTGASVVVPNGVEPAEWVGPQPADPPWLADIPHPRALYVGTLDSRLDVPGLFELAEPPARPARRAVGCRRGPGAIAPLAGVAEHPRVAADRSQVGLVAAVRNATCASSRTPARLSPRR